jgi:hypothetical protein
MKSKTRHTISVGMALVVKKKEELCTPGHHSWVWIEDDTELCSNTLDHLAKIDQWIGQLPEGSPLIYVRTSFGFNGHVIRCSKHEQYAQAVSDMQGEPAIDDNLALHLAGKTAVYRWNLFHHRSGASTIQTHDVEIRDRQAPKCMQLNIETLIWSERYDSSCIGMDAIMSPCSLNPNSTVGYYTPSRMFPKVPHQHFQESAVRKANQTTIVGDGSCDTICQNRNAKCSPEGLVRLNNQIKYDGVFPSDPHTGAPLCERLRASLFDGADQPIIWESQCFARLGYEPTCDGMGASRICICDL